MVKGGDVLDGRRVLGVGVDIVELDRFRALQWPERIAELVLTPREYRRYDSHADRLEYLASRFALKEAVIKAYPAPLTFRDIEIARVGKGTGVRLLTTGRSCRMSVSLAHSTEYVVGFAVVT